MRGVVSVGCRAPPRAWCLSKSAKPEVCLVLTLSPLSTPLSPGTLLAANTSLVVHVLGWNVLEASFWVMQAAPRCCLLSQAQNRTALKTQLHDGYSVAFP